MQILAEVAPLDPVSGNRITLRASSVQDRRVTALNSQRWWPAIAQMPTLGIRLFDGDFSSDVEPASVSFALLADKLERLDANVRRYLWAGATITLYAGEIGDAWPWTQVFSGIVDRFEQQANLVRLTGNVDIAPFQKDVLTASYAGTGGAEGGADLKNRVKPWVFGRALNVEPVLIDATNSVFQFSAYGPIQAVNALYERGSDFGASVGDYATYTALVAATIPAGRWATCLASGMVRLGAPPYGVITGDVDGDKPSGTWIRKTGAIVSRIATNAGVAGGDIDSTSLTALDTAVAYNINLVLNEQTTVLDIARRLARPCNAQAGVSWAGKLFVARVAIGSPAVTLDAQGRQRPAVLSSIESDVSPPYWRVEMGGQRCWRVHSLDEIAFSNGPPVDRGDYSGATTYREGDIVTIASGARYIYISTTPTAGNSPPNVTYWTLISSSTSIAIAAKAATFFQPTPPGLVGSVANDTWVDSDDPNYTNHLRIDNILIGTTRCINGTTYPAIIWSVSSSYGAPVGSLVAGVPAGELVDQAAQADANATAALVGIDSITADGVLDRSEKPETVKQYNILLAEQAGIDAQATAYSITTEKTAYDNAITALTSYLGALSPGYADYLSDTPIVRADFNAAFQTAYAARQVLLNKIAAVAGTVSTWAGVTGAGKAADNATVGAPAGTNVGSTGAATVEGGANAANAGVNSDGTIKTDKVIRDSIAPASTTIKASYSNPSGVTISGTVGYDLIASLTVTDSAGEEIFFSCTFYAINLTDDYANTRLRIRKVVGATTTYIYGTSTGRTVWVTDEGVTVTVTAKDVVAAGDDPTYYVEAQGLASGSSSGSESIFCPDITFVAQEVLN